MINIHIMYTIFKENRKYKNLLRLDLHLSFTFIYNIFGKFNYPLGYINTLVTYDKGLSCVGKLYERVRVYFFNIFFFTHIKVLSICTHKLRVLRII